MWQNESQKRFFWAGIGEDFDKMLKELSEIEQDEEVDLYRFKMHLANEKDLEAFDDESKQEILDLFKTLMEDTERHSKTIRRIHRVLSNFQDQALKEGLQNE